MTEEIKQLILSNNKEDNWLGVEIMRSQGYTEDKIANYVGTVIGHSNKFIEYAFILLRWKYIKHTFGEYGDHGNYIPILRRDINDKGGDFIDDKR